MLISSSFYNTIAHAYKSYCKASHINDFLDDDITLVERHTPKSILELGVGNGRFANAYLKRNPETYYVGVDNSKEMLAQVKKTKAVLICDDFTQYTKQLQTKGERFDCVIAPYTAIHHITRDKQLELFETVKQITNTFIINCVTKNEEDEIFIGGDETEITFMLPSGNGVKTVVYKLHETIRASMQKECEGGGRENLLWKNTI